MTKTSSILWMVFVILLILPTPAGKLILDLAGGIFLLIAVIPFVLGGIGWLAWKKIQANINICQSCGANYLNNTFVCPVCGESTQNTKNGLENIPASAATIDIKSEDIK